MKVSNKVKFEVVVATHYGMCFGVKAAIATAQKLAARSPVTILGELAHNATVRQNLEYEGAHHGKLEGSGAETKHVIITAHGASDKERKRWTELGHRVTDTTCPLVHKAHAALRNLVATGYTPIVIGKPGHVEVRGLVGDFKNAQVVQNIEDIRGLNIVSNKIGVISQTTQQIDDVEALMANLRQRFAGAEVKFIDTVCRPTKERQMALLELCSEVTVVVVVGGMNSNNTAQLAEKCRTLGCTSYHVEKSDDVLDEWFTGVDKVGLTAGTSTPAEDVACVKKKLLEISKG
ncbi:MAG: 4-hydroxy-3-methylbut-2-enyl diphosphate reductase [Rubritalea sp.]|jgi:4-hydroxy-3-methylbut-2-enyl diphosphate reductase